jgi:hypothetical protein
VVVEAEEVKEEIEVVVVEEEEEEERLYLHLEELLVMEGIPAFEMCDAWLRGRLCSWVAARAAEITRGLVSSDF